MPRVQLEELKQYAFSHTLAVRATDINYGGHLGTEAIVGLLHEARARLLRQLGFAAVQGSQPGVGLAIGDLVLNLKQEAFAFQQLQLDSHIGEVKEKSFRLFQRISRDGQLVALAETGLVAFDYQMRQPVALPAAFLEALANG